MQVFLKESEKVIFEKLSKVNVVHAMLFLFLNLFIFFYFFSFFFISFFFISHLLILNSMSFVWKHFKRETGNKDKVRCDVDLGNRKCSAVLNCAGGSTKGLIEHIVRAGIFFSLYTIDVYGLM